MRIEKWTDDLCEQKRLLARAPMTESAEVLERTKAIVDDVKARGDEAVAFYREKFDRVASPAFRVPENEMDAALDALEPATRKAIDQALQNLTAFHKAQMPARVALETMPGVRCEMVWRAIDSVGLYVPAGTAPLFSALLMLAVPATLAGCRRAIICTPPQKDGRANPVMLAAAKMSGIREFYTLGGAYAIAAMAYGTAQVPKVDKIFGPGNAYVTAAKQLVSLSSDGAAIDMPAGPSEVMVIAEGDARADWVAADLLAQAEHDVLSQAVLLTSDAAFAQCVVSEVQAQAQELARRDIINKCLQNSRIIVTASPEQSIRIANLYAPEHLIISAPDAGKWMEQIQTAGSVFLGPYSCETAGDYASGTNHVLPTYGACRAYSGLSLYSFLRTMTVQTLSEQGLEALAPTLIQMARAEGLDGHAAAVTVRTSQGTNNG